jgi:hypothetical protein
MSIFFATRCEIRKLLRAGAGSGDNILSVSKYADAHIDELVTAIIKPLTLGGVRNPLSEAGTCRDLVLHEDRDNDIQTTATSGLEFRS